MATNENFISTNICEDCFRLARDVLSGNTSLDENWTTLSSKYATISVAKHLDGRIESLQQSIGAGCKLCKLISDKLPCSSTSPSPETYSLFVQQEKTPKIASKARLQIVTEPVETYIQPVSHWKRPPCLVLFGQRSIWQSSKKFGKKTKTSTPIGPLPFSLLPASHHASPENFSQAEKWLEECRSHHPTCLRGDAPLPNRIVRIQGSEEDMKISLCVTDGEHRRYTAISYSWGESDRIVTLQAPKEISSEAISGNGTYVIEQRDCQGGYPLKYGYINPCDPADIPLRAFPDTLRDAILIAHRLNFEYIWIDSLCIVQDNNEDWDHQVAQLTDIYSGADVVISAAHAETSMSGILNEIPNDRLKIGTLSTENETYDIYVGEPLKALDLESKYISKRAWVFQERLVSTASLHFTDEGLVWECVHGIQASHDQGMLEVTWKKEWKDLLEKKDSNLSDRRLTRLNKTPNAIWYNWIKAYSARSLYNKTDKFPAIAGMASKFAQTFHLTYIAGLWWEDFASGLTWKRHNRDPTLIRYRDPNKYVAPSWSWASVQGRLEYRNVKLVKSWDERKGPDLELVKYNVEEVRKLSKGEDSYGALEKGAWIKVSGLLGKITLDLHRRPGVQNRDFQYCGVSEGFIVDENVVCTLDEYDTSRPIEEMSRYYECWCLRVGSYKVANLTEGDMFLLLDRVKGEEEFHRIGFAETDPNFDNKGTPLFSGILNTPREATTIAIV